MRLNIPKISFLSLITVVTLLTLNASLKVFDLIKNSSSVKDEATKTHIKHIKQLKHEIEGMNNYLVKTTNEVKLMVSAYLGKNDIIGLDSLLKVSLKNKRNVYGLGYCSTRENFAPYYAKVNDLDSIKKIHLDYDYLNDSVKGAWYQEYKKNKWIQPFYGYEVRNYIYDYVEPLIVDNRDTTHFVYVDGSLDQIEKLLRQNELLSGELKYLIDSKGKILYHPLEDVKLSVFDNLNQSVLINDSLINSLNKKGELSQVIIQGAEIGTYFADYEIINELGWKLVILYPNKYINPDGNKSLYIYIELILCLILLVILIHYSREKINYYLFLQTLALSILFAITYQSVTLYKQLHDGYNTKQNEIREQTKLAGKKLEGTLNRLSDAVDQFELSYIANNWPNFVKYFEEGIVNPTDPIPNSMVRGLKEVLNSNQDIYALGFCWNADPAVKKEDLFSPFITKVNRSDVGNFDLSYDYRNIKDTRTEWYHAIKNSGINGKQLDPYYGNDAKTVLIEYGKALIHQNDTLGILYADYAVQDLGKILKRFDMGKTGFSYLIKNSPGMANVFYLPDQKFFKTIDENYIKNRRDKSKHFVPLSYYAKQQKDNGSLREFNAKLTEQNQSLPPDGISIYTDMNSGQDFWRAHYKIESLDWVLVTIYPIHEEPINFYVLRREIIKTIVLVLILCLTAILLLSKENIDSILYHLKLDDQFAISNKSLWAYSHSVSVLLFFSILAVCVTTFKLNRPDFENTDHSKLYDQTSVDVTVANKLNIDVKSAKFMTIPTGVTIKSVDIPEPNKVTIGGYLWQTFNPEIPISDFLIENALSTTKNLLYTGTNEKLDTVKLWSFKSILYQDFNYANYPFDNTLITVEIRNENLGNNAVLVPDFDAFNKDEYNQAITSPDSKPGIDEAVNMGDWSIVRSYYSLKEKKWKENFGFQDKGENMLILDYNMVINRYFLGAFIDEILPFLVIAIFLFSLFLIMRGSTQEKISYIDTAAALFFALLFSHYKLRDSLQFENLVFVEWFYFILYFVIIGYIINRYYYHNETKSVRLIDYRNNVLVKIAYWPVITLLIFLTSIAFFYPI